MRLAFWPIAALLAAAACEPLPTSSSWVHGRVSPAEVDIRLGKQVQFESPFPPERTTWSVSQGPGHGIISGDGLYRAPFIRPIDSVATVVASYQRAEAAARVTFSPLRPDSSDCLGPGQSRLPGTGDHVPVDELPEVLVRVAPTYPDSARQAGVEGTVVVHALVCVSGQVIDVRVARSVPMLDAAAVRAAQQWVFRTAETAGAPVAVWVAIPIRFSLHDPPLARAPSMACEAR